MDIPIMTEERYQELMLIVNAFKAKQEAYKDTLAKVDIYINLLEKSSYKPFTDDSQDYNVNLLAIRQTNTITNLFDDKIVVFWKYKSKWTLKEYTCTTKPGTSYFYNSYIKRLGGVAMLVPGEYKYKLGLHQGRYKALRQAEPVNVYRLTKINESPLEATFGMSIKPLQSSINIHRSNPNAVSTRVNKWSAGCIVINEGYNDFMSIMKKSLSIYNNVTLRLIEIT